MSEIGHDKTWPLPRSDMVKGPGYDALEAPGLVIQGDLFLANLTDGVRGIRLDRRVFRKRQGRLTVIERAAADDQEFWFGLLLQGGFKQIYFNTKVNVYI